MSAMLVIPILPETLGLLHEINPGANLVIEEHETYYVFFEGEGTFSDMIITKEAYQNLTGQDHIIQMLHFPA
jgi:hypothetical protein